jgi:CBS domain-containing protein
VAFLVGRVVFYLLIGWGVWRILNGDIMGGIWIVMIGWFLMSSARGEIQGEKAKREASAVELHSNLEFNVGRSTRALPPMIEGAWSVEQVMARGLPANPMASMPVAKQGELIGFVVRQDLSEISIERRGQVTVADLMDAKSLQVASVNDSAREALSLMDRHRLHQLVVMDNDYVIGMVTRPDIVAALLEFHSEREHPESAGDGTPI